MDWKKIVETEVWYESFRSSGPGGQHVNRTESAVRLFWNLERSRAFSAELKQRMLPQLQPLMDADRNVTLKAEEFRSQWSNKRHAYEKLCKLLEASQQREKKRIPTKATRSSKERKLQNKSRRSEVKQGRKKISY